MRNGRYSRVREIGRGATGAVWLGQDEVLGRPVALKRVGVIPGGVEPDLARAEREARLAAALNHPHVVAVFDLVPEGDGQWLVMEYVEGTSLAELIRRDGPLGPDRTAELLGQAADALAAAHAAGIMHRDVKPSNILVTAAGQAKLTDFGIARAEADATLTQTGLVTGSPAYLSPEVATGRTATAASDVWALGATMFHCLAGRPPYEVGDNVLGAMYRIVNEPPPRLDDAGWLAPALTHTMATDVEDRWSMARVRDFLRGAGVDVTAESDPEPTAVAAAVPTAAPATSEPATPGASAARAGVGRRRWIVLVAVVAALSAVAFALGMNARQDDPPRAGAQPSTSSGPSTTGGNETEDDSATPEPSPSETGEAESEEITAAEMEAFVGTYLATVTDDPRSTWQMLTPEFQAESGNFGQYRRFWSTVEQARVSNVRPDPASSTVRYEVEYEMSNGDVRTDSPSLRLERDGDVLKIAAES